MRALVGRDSIESVEHLVDLGVRHKTLPHKARAMVLDHHHDGSLLRLPRQLLRQNLRFRRRTARGIRADPNLHLRRFGSEFVARIPDRKGFRL